MASNALVPSPAFEITDVMYIWKLPKQAAIMDTAVAAAAAAAAMAANKDNAQKVW